MATILQADKMNRFAVLEDDDVHMPRKETVSKKAKPKKVALEVTDTYCQKAKTPSSLSSSAPSLATSSPPASSSAPSSAASSPPSLAASSSASSAASSAASSPPPKVDQKQDPTTFHECGLSDQVVKAIQAFGFEKPSSIQAKTIRPMCDGKDMLIQCSSGMGKTFAYCIAATQLALTEVHRGNQRNSVLIILPTYEVTIQVVNYLRKLNSKTGIRCESIVGKGLIDEDVNRLKGSHVVVGTGSRVLNVTQRGGMKHFCLRHLFLDEADDLLLSPDRATFVKALFEGIIATQPDMQICLISATISYRLIEFVEQKQILRNEVRVLMNQEKVMLEGIKQYQLDVGEEQNKLVTLIDLLMHMFRTENVIVFCNKKVTIDMIVKVVEKTKNIGSVCALHNDVDIARRTQIIEGSYLPRILVSTDCIARGVDFPQLSVVIIYEIPPFSENFVHRVGRCGRYGRKGIALTFTTEESQERWKKIQKYCQFTAEDLPLNPFS